jgi:RNA polymerase sigma-70 factor, ECF subfamily
MGNFSIVELIDEYEMKLQRYALGLTQDEDRAKDLVQETLMQAMTHLHQLQPLNSYQIQAWLYRVLKNRFIDHVRAAKRELTFYQRLADLTEPAATPEGPPEAETAVGLALDRLPENFRSVLHRRYILGMTSEEIGLELGIPSATVRSRIHLGIKWLQRQHF